MPTFFTTSILASGVETIKSTAFCTGFFIADFLLGFVAYFGTGFFFVAIRLSFF
jgi:hypothetical protein